MADTKTDPQAQIPLTIATDAIGDQATSVDRLGFSPYVDAITSFLTSAGTQPPLTMSIEGEWGSGKSSFMLQLEKAIRGPSPSDIFMQKLPQSMGGLGRPGSLKDAARSWLKQRQQITIQFNAWRHDKQDALWAAFALKVTKNLRKEVGPFMRLKGDISLFFKRLKGLRGWTEFALLFLTLACLLLGGAGLYSFVKTHRLSEVSKVISNLTTDPHTPLPKPNSKGDPEQLDSPYEFLLSHGKWGALLAVAFAGFFKLRQLKIPLSINLEKYLAKPDYEGHAAFIESFHEDFSRLVEAYAKKRRIFVFIDDLDRADVPRAAELMQAINLMIGDTGKLVFILGMDREKVAAGIAQKYKDLLPFMSGLAFDNLGPSSQSGALYFGYSYLEKFIQLSFTLPVLSDPSRFLSLVSGNYLDFAAEDTAVAQEKRVRYLRVKVEKDSAQIPRIAAMVSSIFENNPRRLKQFINIFRLSLFVASSQGIFDQEDDVAPVTPEQLGKFVALMLRFPDLRSALLNKLSLLEDLEAAVQSISGYDADYEHWIRRRGVKKILLYGVERGEEPFDPAIYSLKKFPVMKMMSILPNIPEKPNENQQPGSISGVSDDTSSVSATPSFSADAEVIRGPRSSVREDPPTLK